jgi:protoheme IX farnesyltransferase
MKMLSTVDPRGLRTGAQAVTAALVLVPVSLVPALAQPGGALLATGALVLGLVQFLCAAGFFVERSEPAARRLLAASLVYLPALLGLLALGPIV